MKCKTTFSEAKSMVKCPSLQDAENTRKNEDNEVKDYKYYMRELDVILPEDIMADIEQDRDRLYRQLIKDNSKFDVSNQKHKV